MNETQKFYDRHIEKWTIAGDYPFLHEIRFRRLLKYFKKGESIIDIGCATANHVPLFLGIGRHLKYTGADASRGMLKISKVRYPQLEFIYLDLAKPASYPKKKFNGFWASAVLMHIPWEQWPDLIRNLTKIIKPGGYGFLSLPQTRPTSRSKDDRRHFTLLQPKDFRSFVKKFGWQIKSQGHFIAAITKRPGIGL